MSDKGEEIPAIPYLLILFGLSIGVLDAWANLGHSVHYLLLGGSLGMFAAILSLLGLIPVLGVVIYYFIMTATLDYISVNLPVVYNAGLGFSISYTVISVLFIYLFYKEGSI